MEEGWIGFWVGVSMTAAVIAGLSSVFWFTGPNRHNLGWTDKACVWTTDRVVSGAITKTEHCVSASDIAKWAQEKGL